MPRLFVALSLPEPTKTALAALVPEDAPGVRPVPVERIHLTLRFLGEAEEGRTIAALETVEFPGAFELRIEGTGCFGSRRRPGVLWAGAEESGPLRRLHDSVEAALETAGFSRDSRTWKPHITLARVPPRRGESREERADREEAIASFLGAGASLRPDPVRVENFRLYASEAGASGLVYREVMRFPNAS